MERFERTKDWTLKEAKVDYIDSRNKVKRCANCDFASDITHHCRVKDSVCFFDGFMKALFCKYYTKRSVK